MAPVRGANCDIAYKLDSADRRNSRRLGPAWDWRADHEGAVVSCGFRLHPAPRSFAKIGACGRTSPVASNAIGSRHRASRQKDETPVPDLSSVVASSLAGYYEEVRGRAHQWVAPLSTEQLWRKPYPYGNSIGHLLLHLTGNLSYYIGTQIAGSGYVRDREREFNEARQLPKEQVLAEFDRAIAMVAATIRKQSAEDFAKPYSAALEPEAHDRFTVFLRMAAHAYHHVGQMIYLSKEVTKAAP